MNDNKKQQYTIPVIVGSTEITPINCDLSDNMKKYIAMQKWVKELLEKNASEILRIPKEYFDK